MSPNESDDDLPSDRREPVGAPVVRGDPEITGSYAPEAATFDPSDPDSLSEAAAVVREFADRDAGDADPLFMLSGAAACAALVRGEGSYKAAAERSGVPIGFLRKWARVHDLPISIRRHIALGEIAPTAAAHIARVRGDARFLLAWATLDNDLSVRAIRRIATEVTDGTPLDEALREHGAVLGRTTVTLPADVYRELRRRSSLENTAPDEIIAEALRRWLTGA